MNGLIQDLRFALRQLAKNPGFTTIAVLTLALGIGANTAIFSVVNGVLLNPLPFPDSHRIVTMYQDKPNFPKGSISYPNFLDWQRENHSFEALAAYRWSDGSITGVGQPERVKAERVSATFLSILGVTPILGRNFTPEEDRRGANGTAILSEGLWKRKFGSDPNIIGKRIIVGGQGRTIVGVIPASFRLVIQNLNSPDILEPIGEDADAGFYRRDSFWGTDAIGKLKPGITLAQAHDDMQRVNSGLAGAYPDIDAHIKSTIITLKDAIVGDTRPVLLVLLGAVCFVLLIACVNVANLLLARSTARQREFSVRVALGAAQGRILRQVLTESVLLAVIGGGLGLLLAKWGTHAAIAAIPRGVPRAEEIGLDFRVLGFAFLISVLTGIVFGLVPALKMSRTNVGEALKDSGRSVAASRSRAQAMFVIGEMAMALVLLVGAGLMLRSLMQLWGLDAGFDPHNVLSFHLTMPPSVPEQTPDAIRAAFRRVESEIQSVPGVGSVSLSDRATLMQSDDEVDFVPEGESQPSHNADLPSSLVYSVGPEYLRTMRIPLLRGRFIADSDTENAQRVAVIDSSFARKYFPGQDPVGKHLRVLDFDTDPAQLTWMDLTIVGVVGHANQFGLANDATHSLHAQLYRSFMQASEVGLRGSAQGTDGYIRFQSSLNPEAFLQTLRKKLQADSGDIIISDAELEENVVARSIASQRFSLVLLGAFAGLALLLASVGIYGVLSYLVGLRTREIGVRMALGARPLDVLRQILGDGARMTLIGAVLGLVAALALTRWMASLLFEVKPTDPATFAAVAAILCAIAMFACYLPARRAMRLDPVVALRNE